LRKAFVAIVIAVAIGVIVLVYTYIKNVNEVAVESNLTLPDLFSKVEKSVVEITSKGANNLAAPESETRLGSGFIYDNNRHIITNTHVPAGNEDLAVTFLDGTRYPAKLVGSDAFTDLAVLYIENVPKDKLVPLPLGNSTALRVGEEVAAIGNPFGLSGSMTQGIISGLGRRLPANPTLSGQYSISDVIQTDAPINPGNSGGPLLNMMGEVIGITSAIESQTGEFAGIGFAIPSNTISRVVPILIAKGSIEHAWLGITGTDMTPEIAQATGLKEPKGFLVVHAIAGSPAAMAGILGGHKQVDIEGRSIILGGDVIIGIDNKTVRNVDDILVYLDTYKEAGNNLTLKILRNGEIQDVHVTLGTRPNLQASP